MTQAANSALSSARLRFVEGLPARAEELSGTAERLARDPSDPEAAAMLRRRLHALLASAQVFEERALSLAVQDLIARLDIAQRAQRPFTTEEIDAVGLVVASLPTYVRPSLQPPAAYSDVRELRSDERATEPAPKASAADGGDTWRPPPRERARAAKTGEVAVPEGLRVKTEIEPDEVMPAALADLAQAASSDRDGEPGDVGAARAFELAEGRPDERPLPPRSRRIVALAALQGSYGSVSFESEAEDQAALSGRLTALDERAPGETAEMLIPIAADLAANGSEDSWSQAVAAAGDAMAAWRDSMRASAPVLDLDGELGAEINGTSRAGILDTSGATVAPAWLELNRLESAAESIVGGTFGVQKSIERNSLAAAEAAAAPERDAASDTVVEALPELEPELETEAPVEREMRPEIAEWGDTPTELHERSQALPTAAGDLEAGSESALVAPEVGVRLNEAPAIESPWVADADADSSATTGISIDTGFVEPDFSEQTSPGFGPPVLLKQTVSGLRSMHTPARVLLVADAAGAGRARSDLSSEHFQVVYAASADEAVRRLHESKPDLVFVAADLASSPEADVVRRLKHDPLAPVARAFVLMPEHATYDDSFLDQIGADGAVKEPLTDASVEPLLQPNEAAESSEPVSPREGTIDEIAAQIAEEIRRGIAESLRTGQQEPARPSGGSQLMAAAWSAIGRVRSHLAEQNRGRSAGDSASSSSLLPAVDPSVAGNRTPSIHPSQLLAGQRVLVADDDPAVLWFFVGLLREASAQVLQAHNGREALELARRKQPHVIVSDILMPKLDGFGLCRELKRDALLSHVPVILLSWKDDLLQRMRELDAGAAGYLRKEAGSQQILAQLTEVLEPRTRFVAKLRAQAEVSGTLAGLGALSLLELVAAERPDAHLAVRDAWHLFEIDIRAGRRLSVTRTAADGTFTRGEKALMQLLGLAGGEFNVSSSSAPLKAPIPEPLDRALAAAGRRLSALLDSVSDARLLRVSLVAFDDEVLQSLSSAESSRLHEVIALFRTGHATAEGVLREGRYSPGELEDYLRELARSVAITGVWGSNGEDLVLAAQRERETPQLALLSSTLPPRSRSGTWSLAPEVRQSVGPTVSVASTSTELSTSTDAEPSAELVTTPEVASLGVEASDTVDTATVVDTELTDTATSTASTRTRRSSLPPSIIESSSVAFTSVDSDTGRSTTTRDVLADTLDSPPPSAADELAQTKPGIGESEQAPVPEWLKPSSASVTTTIAPPASATAELASQAALALLNTPAVRDEAETDAVSKAELESFDLPVPSTFARAFPQRIDTLRLAGTLVVLAGVGYIGWQQFALPADKAAAPQTRVEAAKTPPADAPARPPVQQPPAAAPAPAVQAAPQPTPQAAPPTIQNTQFGKVLPFVDTSRGVAVAPDQGLLVIELQGSDQAPNVRVGTRELGKPPIAVALPAGRHELVVRAGKSTSFRYLVVRPGETRIVSVPLAEL